ncbi:glutathione S-transferase N-terminal domain-containing protein [Zavarzinia sp. CC-PAN008]|uniref:glutathione S-transferase N-terminal domain-containing protein n=1 Tax=Zavarzinia sp. CC-PAN008 TaxID=3243332 RepID=UPI003F743264
MLDIYFAPLSCSMATRIAIHETGLEARFHEVVLSTKLTRDGEDFRRVNPTGQVPALVTGEGDILTEGTAILQYLADQAPQAGLAPASGTLDRARLHQWLNFIATEVHKAVFAMIFNPASPPEAKAFARSLLPLRYDRLSRHLEGRDYLVGEGFTVADAYLVTTFNWADPAGVDLSPWPVLVAWRDRQRARPSVARALGEELALRAA